MNLKEKSSQFPASPGVYLMKDGQGEVLYVGKASNLKKRIASYFSSTSENRYQIRFLMKRVRDLDTIVTENEKEAFLLENTLIKKYHPKYNIQLRDDKSYLSLKLSVRDKFPRLYVTRQIKKDGSFYFGPYSSGGACRETVDFIEQNFRLRTCSDQELINRTRPCLQYQIHRCDAPCVGLIPEESYRKTVEQVKLFLQGRKQELVKEAEQEMVNLSDREEFEKAAKARDLVQSLRETLQKQTVAQHRWIDQDAIGFYREGERITFCVVEIREGKVWESRLYHLKDYQEDFVAVSAFLNQYYGEDRLIPDEILLPCRLEDKTAFQEVLRERRGKPCSLLSPQSGDRRDLVRLALRNAREGFDRREKKQEELGEILDRLQSALHLQNLPRRIECFDISNISGQLAVGSLVSFVQGESYKEGYRRFRIRSVEGPDDFSMMKEVLKRRLLRGEKEGEAGEKWEKPEMILIDGGKGQLNSVIGVMEELNITGIDIAALAKAREGEAADKVYLPGRKNPVKLKPQSSLLHLLMRIRDEAHRFAITYHKKLRKRQFLATN